MSRPIRTVTIELQLDPDQIWEVDTDNPSRGHERQRMDVYYVKWEPVSVYVTVSGYVVLARDPVKQHGGNWRKTIQISEVPSAVKAQLIGACHPSDLPKSEASE